MKFITCLILSTILILSNWKISHAFSGGGVNATVSVVRKDLPPTLKVFDINGLGRLLLFDLSKIVKIWIEDKDKCDINKDKVCDTEDFSILMYNIQR